MAYLILNGVDISKYVNSLKVGKKAVYNAKTNAAGDSVVDFINAKREIEVGFIPLNDTVMAQLQAEFDKFNAVLSYRNPKTNALENNVNCIIPDDTIEYYTIQANKVSYKPFTIKFTEL